MSRIASGERTLKVGRKRYRLRFDFRAIAEVEDYFEDKALSILRKLMSEIEIKDGEPNFLAVSITEIAEIFKQMLISGGMSEEEAVNAGDLMLEAGFVDVTYKVLECFSATLTASDVEGGGSSRGKKKEKTAAN